MHVAQGFKDATGPPYAPIWVCFRFAKPRRGTAALWFKALFQKLQQPQHTRRCRSWTKMTVAVFVVQVCVLRIRSTANTSVLSIDHQGLLLVASPVTLWRGHVGSESIRFNYEWRCWCVGTLQSLPSRCLAETGAEPTATRWTLLPKLPRSSWGSENNWKRLRVTFQKTYLHQGMVTDVDEVTSVGWLFGGMKLIN